ncbi:MAG: TIM barrel protein [Firmicutes bacterium]|nr:TIM barrel protein [Bacillota bacterium]MCL2256145.1 TIM barrel protein [Bacillota bacterium]
MYLGISTASFFNRVPNEHAFETLTRMGIPFTEVFLNTHYEYERPFVGLLTTKKGHINIHSVHALGTQFEPELFSDNSRVRYDAEETFKKVCYAGAILGARYYTFHGPLKLTKHSTLDYGKFFARLNQLSDIALGMNIRLSYENVSYSHASEPEFFERMLRECPGVTCTLDVKQALQAGINPKKFLDVMGKKISTIHLCDYAHGKTYLPNKKSNFNFEDFFAELKERNASPVMMLEVYPKDYKDINELKVSYDYLRGLMLAPRKENKVKKLLTKDLKKYDDVDLTRDKKQIKAEKQREKEFLKLEKAKSLAKIREEKERIAMERAKLEEEKRVAKEKAREAKKEEKTTAIETSNVVENVEVTQETTIEATSEIVVEKVTEQVITEQPTEIEQTTEQSTEQIAEHTFEQTTKEVEKQATEQTSEEKTE